jgi:hypothetical protein
MDKDRSSRKNSVEYVLADPEKRANETYGPGGLLATLFRNILAALEITPARWSKRMQIHFDETSKLNYSTRKDLSGVRANINSAFLGDSMTWKSLCKGVVFLGMSKMRVTIEVSRGGNSKVHSAAIEVDFGRRTVDDIEREMNDDGSPNLNAVKLGTEVHDGQRAEARDGS